METVTSGLESGRSLLYVSCLINHRAENFPGVLIKWIAEEDIHRW